MVADAPVFPEVYPTDAVIKDQRVIIYNAAFDQDFKLLLSASQFTNFEVGKTLRLFDGMGSAMGRKLKVLS